MSSAMIERDKERDTRAWWAAGAALAGGVGLYVRHRFVSGRKQRKQVRDKAYERAEERARRLGRPVLLMDLAEGWWGRLTGRRHATLSACFTEPDGIHNGEVEGDVGELLGGITEDTHVVFFDEGLTSALLEGKLDAASKAELLQQARRVAGRDVYLSRDDDEVRRLLLEGAS